MTDILFPPGLAPRRVTWTLERAVATYESPLSFASQRVARSGARWRASIEMPPLDSTETGLLNGWLDQISRAENCGLMPVFQNNPQGQSGSATFAEMQVPWHERDANLDWTRQQLLSAAYMTGRDLGIYSTSGTSAGTQAFITRTFTVTQGLPYLLTIDIPDQLQRPGLRVTDGVTDLVNVQTTFLPAGRTQYRLTAASTSLQVFLYPGNGQVAFVASRITALSLCRAMVVASAAVAGSEILSLIGAAGAASPSLTHSAGQFVSIETAGRWELKRLRADVHMIGSSTINGVSVLHLGRAEINPPLRSAVSSGNGTTQHLRPACRMRLAEPNSSATIDAPLFGGFAFDLVEWFGA